MLYLVQDQTGYIVNAFYNKEDAIKKCKECSTYNYFKSDSKKKKDKFVNDYFKEGIARLLHK